VAVTLPEAKSQKIKVFWSFFSKKDCLPWLILTSLLVLDHTPRFFQGDSFSYLLTGQGGWIPPDRSWLFGFIASDTVRALHGYFPVILLQAALLGCMIRAARPFYESRWHEAGRIAFACAAAALALDPVLALYTRFVMSDLMALAMFWASLCGLLAVIRPGSRRPAWGLAVFAASTIAAVFLRVAYAAIIQAAILTVAALMLWRLPARRRAMLAAALLAPLLAVCILVGANRVVFRQQFPDELFTTKLSGVFLAAVFAPALEMQDFASAGIPITQAEFRALDLGNYDRRLLHVWGGPGVTLQQFIAYSLGITQLYTQAVDRAAFRLVASAARRSPLAMLKVYGENLLQYCRPADWARHADAEMGLDLPLPDAFVTLSRTTLHAKIGSGTSQIRSPLIRAYLATCRLYPFQLATGLLAASYLLARRPVRPGAIVLAAGLFADLAAAPLYSNYVIPRYVLGAIFLSPC
jgi:hypothetical protein